MESPNILKLHNTKNPTVHDGLKGGYELKENHIVYIKPKQTKTKELEFLHTFKESGFFNNYLYGNNENFTFIEEPYTGFGYPDLVFLAWNKKINKLWVEERNKLTLNDIKVAQHLYNSNTEKSLYSIAKELGFSDRQIHNILYKLYAAGIVEYKKDLWALKEIKNVFFIEKIVTIEAKLKNWRRALLQASSSEYFSSEVFTLFPDNIINENLINSYSNTNVGIISYGQNYRIVKPANQKSLPITINGWLFNELIGRILWRKKRN